MNRAERDSLIHALGQKTSQIAEMRYRIHMGMPPTGDMIETIARTEQDINRIADILYPRMPEGGAS